MTLKTDNTLPSWMISILTEEEKQEIENQAQIPLHIHVPMTKEEVVEESDIIEEQGIKETIIDIASPLNPNNTYTL